MLRTPLLVAVAVTALLSGCAASAKSYGASTDGNAPPLPPGLNVRLWDYYCAYLDPGRGGLTVLHEMLADASNNGWELVAVSDVMGFCFKRPRHSVTAAPGAEPARVLEVPAPGVAP